MFKDLGIKSRMLLLTLLPSSLLAIVLSVYFIWSQLTGMQEQLQQRGQLIIEQLATLSATAMQQQDQQQLGEFASQTLELVDVRSVSFLTPNYQPLVSVGPQMLSPTPQADAQQLSSQSAFDTTRLLLPVTANSKEQEPRGPLLGWVELELTHQATLLQGYRSLLSSFGLVLLVLTLATLLALRLSGFIQAPLRRLQQGVMRLQEGQLDTRIAALGSQEMNTLAEGINCMAAALQDERHEMQQSIEQAIEDARQNLEIIEVQNIELDMARKEALEASRIKSEFLANMSHEIRTPLNGIIGFANLLKKTTLSARQLDYLHTIQKSADNLLGILSEVLDFSKIEAGKLTLERMPFNLRDLIQDCLSILAPAAHEKQLELVSLIYRDTPINLIGDPSRLKQILTNLISNAIKFTAQGSIVVRAMLEDESNEFVLLRISVQDSGIGLDSTDVQGLFQAFNQVDNSLTRQVGGTGLGLAISKRLIEMMGGEIGVDSVPGEGAEFWICVNLAKAHEEFESPPAALLGRRAAVFEPHELAHQSLLHQLEDCGVDAISFASMDNLLQTVANQQSSLQPISLAVLGVSARDLAPEQISLHLHELQQLNCKTLILCPTTEQSLFSDILSDADSQLQSKPACTRKLMRALSELVNPRIASLEPADQLPPLRINGRPPLLLCVDDSPANLLLVQTLLTDMGAQVTAVDSGFAALDAVALSAFDLIFMDIQMPGMDGRQATLAIRQHERELGRKPVPIVALTAHALPDEKRSLLQDGMDDYLAKPASEQQLRQMILKWSGQSLSQPAAVATATAPTEALLPEGLAVLDPEEALNLAGGKAELANDLLAMLLGSLSDEQNAIRQARASNAGRDLADRVHRLLGATRYCGVPQLRAACQHCETLIKQNSEQVPQALDQLDAAINRLQEESQQQSATTQ